MSAVAAFVYGLSDVALLIAVAYSAAPDHEWSAHHPHRGQRAGAGAGSYASTLAAHALIAAALLKSSQVRAVRIRTLRSPFVVARC